MDYRKLCLESGSRITDFSVVIVNTVKSGFDENRKLIYFNGEMLSTPAGIEPAQDHQSHKEVAVLYEIRKLKMVSTTDRPQPVQRSPVHNTAADRRTADRRNWNCPVQRKSAHSLCYPAERSRSDSCYPVSLQN